MSGSVCGTSASAIGSLANSSKSTDFSLTTTTGRPWSTRIVLLVVVAAKPCPSDSAPATPTHTARWRMELFMDGSLIAIGALYRAHSQLPESICKGSVNPWLGVRQVSPSPEVAGGAAFRRSADEPPGRRTSPDCRGAATPSDHETEPANRG